MLFIVLLFIGVLLLVVGPCYILDGKWWKKWSSILCEDAYKRGNCLQKKIAVALSRISTTHSSCPCRHIIVDTDLNYDDLISLGYLLSQPDKIRIDLIILRKNGMVPVDRALCILKRFLAMYHKQLQQGCYACSSHQARIIVAYGVPSSSRRNFPEFLREQVTRNIETFLNQVKAPCKSKGDNLIHLISQGQLGKVLVKLMDQCDPRSGTPIEYDYLCLGALTNLAYLIRRHDWAVGRMGRLVAMAGAIKGHSGNLIDNPNSGAEYSAWIDPAAVKTVITRLAVGTKPRIEFVPLNATDMVPIDCAWVKSVLKRAMEDKRSKSNRFLAKIVYQMWKESQQNDRTFYLWEVVATVLWANAKLYGDSKWISQQADIDICTGKMTLVSNACTKAIRFCIAVDGKAIKDHLVNVLFGYE